MIPILRLEPTVLLAEDDDDVRLTTSLVLERQGFDVVSFADGEAAWAALESRSWSVAVLDIAMPRLDGLTFVTRLRATGSDLPVVLLTARDLAMDEVTGLRAGADDYVTKPYDGVVLAERIHAVIRRRRPGSKPEQFGALTIDRAAHVVAIDAREVALTSTEYRLLELLIEHAGAVVSRGQALRRVWGDEDWIDDRVVDTVVKRLRAKVGFDTIETIRGFGYKWVARG